MVKVVPVNQHRRMCHGCGRKGIQRLLLSDGSGTLNVGLCLACYQELRKLVNQEVETGAETDPGPRESAAVPVP